MNPEPEYKEGHHKEFIQYIFSDSPKEPGEVKLELPLPEGSEKCKNIGLHLFEQLLMIFVDGLKYFYGKDGKVIKKVEESFITEKAKKGLAAKAEKSGMPQSVLRSVYNRGMAAWKTGHRPGTTPQQWAMARVNSFTTKSSGTWGGADKDLAAKVRKEDVNLDCQCEDCQCNPCECGDWREDMGPQSGGMSTENAENLGEALDMKQRLARGRSARKNKSKLAMGRKKAGRRIASMKVLKKRARRAARKTLTKRLTKGIAKTDLSVSRKREIEKRLDKPAFKIKANRLVKRTIKDIRKKEIARKRK